jgi:hypothetical protein
MYRPSISAGEYQNIYINHTREILVEMSMFAKCKKIISFNYFLSSFIVYGYVHNEIYTSWKDKRLYL